MFLCAVATIGFEQTQYTTVENATVSTEVCVMLMPLVTLGRTVTVTVVSLDGTAQGKKAKLG